MNEAANDYRKKTILEEAPGKIQNLEMASWIPSAFSIVTASFLVFYLAQPYPLLTKIAIILILGAVIIVNEIVKRRTVQSSVRDIHRHVRPSLVILAGMVLTVIISMGSSFVGGNNGVQQNVPRPTLAANPTVDSLKKEVAKYDQEIAAYQATTWKGKVVNDVRPMLRVSTDNRNLALQEITRIEAKEASEYQATLSRFESQLISFGWIFGGLAALCDIFLIMIRFAIERIRRDLFDAYGEDPAAFQAAIYTTSDYLPKGPTPPPPSGRKKDPKVRSLHERNPAPTEAHRSDEYYDPAELVDEKSCNSVATDEQAQLSIDTYVAAYKDAKKQYDAWVSKEKNGKGTSKTNESHQAKWRKRMDYYIQQLELLQATDEIEQLEARA